MTNRKTHSFLEWSCEYQVTDESSKESKHMRFYEFLCSTELYSRGDDAVYYCAMNGFDWSLMLHYSVNHHVCNAEFWNQEELDQDYNVESLREDDESGYWKDFFESELKFFDWQTITE